MQVQVVKIDKYRSNSEVLHREDLLFLKVTKHTKSEPFLSSLCECPNIMSCDDDIFQHFVVGSLINSDEFKQFKIPKKISFHEAGESLLEEFINLQVKCSCSGPQMIISDYHMGELRLDGVQVAQKLRSLGYKGAIILRTSNSMESILDDHPDFAQMIDRKVINCFLSKSNLKKQREEFGQYLVRMP